ncbi:MAG: thioredoxin [Myxococcota bacterium]
MASELITDTTDSDFQRDVIDSTLPVLVDFWATWCGPCRAIAPHVEAIANDFSGRLKVVKIDIDANPDTPAKFGIRGIPTLLVFKGGEMVDKLVGNPGSKAKMAELVQKHVAAVAAS